MRDRWEDLVVTATFLVGAVLAGGRSRRYGRPKALVEVGGVPMVRRALDSLRSCGLRVAVVGWVADTPGLDVPLLTDLNPGRGALGGIETALAWGRGEGAEGVFVLGCDMPLVPPELVSVLVERFQGIRPVAPASFGPLGLETLCTVYPVSAHDEVARRVGAGGGSLVDVLRTLGVDVLPPERVAEVADPAVVFSNVNTPADLERVEGLLDAARRGKEPGGVEREGPSSGPGRIPS